MSFDHQNVDVPLPPKTGNWFARHKLASGGLVVALGVGSALSGCGEAKDNTAAQVPSSTVADTNVSAPPVQSAAEKAAAEREAAEAVAASRAADEKAAAAAQKAAEKAAEEAAGPRAQQAFVNAVVTGAEAYEGEDNELRQRQAQRARNQAVCAAVPDRKATDWVATIKNIETNGSGKGVLELTIGDHSKVTTWNNAVSDYADNTLIPTDSQVYATLSELEEGDAVRFSGTFLRDSESCLSEISMTLNGQMTTPNFLFRFSKLSAM